MIKQHKTYNFAKRDINARVPIGILSFQCLANYDGFALPFVNTPRYLLCAHRR